MVLGDAPRAVPHLVPHGMPSAFPLRDGSNLAEDLLVRLWKNQPCSIALRIHRPQSLEHVMWPVRLGFSRTTCFKMANQRR